MFPQHFGLANGITSNVKKVQSAPKGISGYFWRGADGNVYVQGSQGINAAKKWDANTQKYWTDRGYVQTADSSRAAPVIPGAPDSNLNKGTGTAPGGSTFGGGAAAAPKVLDQAQLDSLQSLLSNFDASRDQLKQKAALTRDARKREKDEEKKREKGKYDGKKLSTLQDFAGAKTDTDINTRNTLENLVSSLSVMGLGGSRALTRQILDASNMSNRKANQTQAQNNQSLDSAFNEFTAANENDVKKINDQYGYDVGEAEKQWAQQRQNTLYKMADVYNAADKTNERQGLMNQGNDLNGVISRAAFMNPSYTGETRAMKTPDLADYTQDIARYDTTSVGADGAALPAADGTTTPGNLAVRAIAVNDKDLGIKKKTEGDLGYGA